MKKVLLRGAFLAAALALSACQEESAMDVAAKNLNVAGTNSSNIGPGAGNFTVSALAGTPGRDSVFNGGAVDPDA